MTFSVPDLAAEIANQISLLNKPDREWDEYVPIKKSTDGKQIDIFLFENIEAPPLYSRMIYELLMAESDVTVNLHINNGGGYIDSANSIVAAITNSKANVIAHLSGTVASAATVIALACPTIIVEPDLSFMVHEASFQGLGGKFSDMKTFQTYYDKHTKDSSRRTYLGFLTDSEIEEMHRGKEHWFNAEEVQARVVNRQLYLAGKLQPSTTPVKRGRPRKDS